MAGFFGLFDYTKEGPGVEIDEPQKGPVGDFFSIVGTKFWKLITINFMMVIFNIVGIAVAFVVANWLGPLMFPNFSFDNISKIITSLNLDFADEVTAEAYASHLFISSILCFTFTFVGLQFFTVGPAQAGFTYLLRNYSRHAPAFTWMDFRDNAKTNFKQSLLHSLISGSVYFLMGLAFFYYGAMMEGNLLSMILQAVIVVCLILFTMMQFYIYQLMITFDLSMKDIYKNALLFTFLRLPSNFGVLLICAILLFVIPILVVWMLPNVLAAFVIFILYVVILLSFTLLLINYQANRGIYKHMLKPLLDKAEAETQAELEAEMNWKEEDEEEEDEEEDEKEAKSGREVPSGAPA